MEGYIEQIFKVFSLVGPLALSAFVTLILAASIWETVASFYFVVRSHFQRENVQRENVVKESHSEKLSKLTSSLVRSSKDVESILAELSQVAQERSEAVKKLESQLATLEVQEEQYKKRVEALKTVRPDAVAYLLKELEPSERRSTRRDYFLFAAGVLASVVTSIILRLFGLA